jgi:hypothetical protein
MSAPNPGFAKLPEGVQENLAAARRFPVRIGDIAAGRAGDKGDMLDLTLVAQDDAAYRLLENALQPDAVRAMLGQVVPGPVQRYLLPGLRVLKFVLPQALPGGVYASLRPGLHWQKAAIWLLLDLQIDAQTLQLRWGGRAVAATA